MFENLNARTKDIISALMQGESVKIGADALDPFSTKERLLLFVIAKDLETLASLSGTNLSTELVNRLRTAKTSDFEPEVADDSSNHRERHWKLANITAYSFRGLAPANKVWEYKFDSESHLLYGPNGCGKSSLLGAIAWCLTGKVFRDDQPPSNSETIDVFTIERKPKKSDSRPAALSLLDETGNSVSSKSEYWVKLRLKSKDPATGTDHDLWIQRNSETGLSMSPNDSEWSEISNLAQTGISELETELRVIMPARVPHLQFGENPDLVRLFSQIIGLDDLATIASVADAASRALKAGATRIENGELLNQDELIDSALSGIKDAATAEIESWPEYERAIASSRTLDDIRTFGEKAKQATESWREQLINDIGLAMPPREDPAYVEFESQLAQLAGRVQTGTDRLSRPIGELFETSLGHEYLPKSEVIEKVERLNSFAIRATEKVREHVEWETKKKTDPKADLLLVASGQFEVDEDSCPVCTQKLDVVPTVRDQLIELKPLSKQSHLTKKTEDLERELISQLDSIIERADRAGSEFSLGERIGSDWHKIKDAAFTGLLQPIAETFDDKIEAIAASANLVSQVGADAIWAELKAQLPNAFEALSVELESARSYLMIASAYDQHSTRLEASLFELLSSESETASKSLLQILKRGDVAGRQLQVLDAICRDARTLWIGQKKRNELETQIEEARDIAKSATATKSLSQVVRKETIRMIADVEPQTKTNFERLYNNGILEFDMLTTGHAANPEIKNQINVYLKSGNERVPIGPFTNAGRLRALVLSFVFALMDRRTNTLGVLILDDPALSLDDEHKARFVDSLVQPMLASNQLIVATHYESFFKIAEPIFKNYRCLHMPPKRTVQDHVAFAPADLLKRLEVSISNGNGSWREHGINLRRWAERTLRMLSGFCPEPFFVFNDIPGTVDAYARISDPRIATDRRDRVVADLRTPVFTRVMHRFAHDEDPTESEVTDGLMLLKNCQKEAVDIEIERLKVLYNHASLGRAIDSRPSLNLLSFVGSTAVKTLQISGEAAAASGGVGINWIDDESVAVPSYHAIRVTSDVLTPIAQAGDIILLDSDDVAPNDSDLVAVQLEDGRRLIRRFWARDHTPYLESVNATSPSSPVVVSNGKYHLRKIKGVLFYRHVPVHTSGAVGEWDDVGEARRLLIGLTGVRVRDTSMEPIARNNQIVLINKEDVRDTLRSGELACIDAVTIEAVLKRCFLHDQSWILNSVNAETIEAPILLPRQNIRNVYRVSGILFEPN